MDEWSFSTQLRLSIDKMDLQSSLASRSGIYRNSIRPSIPMIRKSIFFSREMTEMYLPTKSGLPHLVLGTSMVSEV